MRSRFFFAAATACALATASLAFASCKSNDVTQNNYDQYESYASQAVTPEQGAEIDGPDGAHVSIPAHALATTTTIGIGRMKPQPGNYPDLPSGWTTSGGVYSFEPHNQTFALDVAITVPYADNGKPLRLAGSEPGGAWSPIDGVVLTGGNVKFQSPHFSFYTVVTGAPVDTTLRDGGSDATIPDAAPDAPAHDAEAGPPPPPTTVFFSALSESNVYRFFVNAPLDDAGGNGDAQANDGGWISIDGSSPPSLAFGASTLFVGEAQNNGTIAPFSDPFATLSAGSTFGVQNPGPMVFGGGTLFVTTSNFTVNAYSPTGALEGQHTMSNAVGGLAYDEPSNTLYVLYGMPPQIDRYAITGTLTKTFTQVGDAGALNIDAGVASSMGMVPWGEILVVVNGAVQRFNLQGNYVGTYTSPAQIEFMVIAAVGGVRWPNGVDEIFLSEGEKAGIKRYMFAPGDTSHTNPILNGVIPTPTGHIPNSMVLAP